MKLLQLLPFFQCVRSQTQFKQSSLGHSEGIFLLNLFYAIAFSPRRFLSYEVGCIQPCKP